MASPREGLAETRTCQALGLPPRLVRALGIANRIAGALSASPRGMAAGQGPQATAGATSRVAAGVSKQETGRFGGRAQEAWERNGGILTQARRPPGRPRRSEASARDGILAAAAALFLERGYRAVSVETVAAAAGVTKAAVYYHFADKPSLMTEAARVTFARARQATEAVLARPLPLRQRLEAIATIVLGLPQSFTEFDTMMHEARADLSPAQIADILAQERSVSGLLEEAVADAAARGELRTEAPVLVAHAVLAMLRVGQARGADGNPLFPDHAATARALIALLWDGVGPHEGRA